MVPIRLTTPYILFIRFDTLTFFIKKNICYIYIYLYMCNVILKVEAINNT